MAHPGVGDDRGAAGGGGRLPAALARPDADQGQGRHAYLLAPRQGRVRQTITHAASSRVSGCFLSLGTKNYIIMLTIKRMKK